METIHSILAVIKRMIRSFHLKTDMAATNNTIFLPKVCQLVNTQASPKHPQSDTGSAKARYKVNGVITPINNKANVDARLLRMPRNKKIPALNSTADKTMPKNKGK